jgi:hypothetical protein
VNRGIQTEYAGHVFRSRLEARWAALFDLMRWDWVYEPLDADGYIPDFLLMGERPVLVEVKPAVSIEEMRSYLPKIERGLKPVWQHDVLIVGNAHIWPEKHNLYSHPPLGLLGEWGDEWEPGEPGWSWELGRWHTCSYNGCGRPAFHHELMSFVSRPCGHYSGDHYLGSPPTGLPGVWGQAHEVTKWTAVPTT